jgi:hypothetical protein
MLIGSRSSVETGDGMGRTTFGRRGAAIGIALALLAAGGSAAAQPFVQVSRDGSKFSVDASGASVSAVLEALGREAGFRVQDSRPDVERPPIDIALTGATLDQALNRLLERQNHLIVYRSSAPSAQTEPGAIERIVLLGPRSEQPKVPLAKNAGASPLAGPVQSQPPPARPPNPGAPPVPAPQGRPGAPGAIAQPATGSGPVPPGAVPPAALPPAAAAEARRQMLDAAAAAANSFAQQQGLTPDQARALSEAAAAQVVNPEAIPGDQQ